MKNVAAVVAAALLLAGCSTDGPEGGDGLDAGAAGVVHGVVVDAGIRPLAGVNVSLVGTGFFAATDDDGAFRFEGVVAGTLFLRANKEGFAGLQTTVEVIAGVSDPDPLRLKLDPLLSGLPWAEPYSQHGFIECSTSAVAACALAQAPQQTLCHGNPNIPGNPEPGICTGNITNERSSIWQMVAPGLTFAQFEVVWDFTNPASETLRLVVRGADYGAWLQRSYDETFGELNATSPMVLTASDAQLMAMNAAGIGLGTGDEAHGFELDLFATGTAGLAVEQPFDMFLTVFHGYKPPPGWVLYENGEAPPPP